MRAHFKPAVVHSHRPCILADVVLSSFNLQAKQAEVSKKAALVDKAYVELQQEVDSQFGTAGDT